MKLTLAVITILGIIIPNFATGFEGQVIFSKCKDFKLRYPEIPDLVHLNHVFGIWRVARSGPWGSSKLFDNYDCITNLIYRDQDTKNNALKYLFHARGPNRKHTTMTGSSTINLLNGENGLEVENLFFNKISIGGLEVPTYSAFVDSDNGETYAILATCFEYALNNKTEVWSILTRERFVDPKLSIKLSVKIHKIGGVKHADLLGVGHTNCHKHHEHNGS